jgi:hypothetical protein
LKKIDAWIYRRADIYRFDMWVIERIHRGRSKRLRYVLAQKNCFIKN